MDSVKYILGFPEKVDDIEIHPVTMRYYDEFMQVANILTVSYQHFDMDKVKEMYSEEAKLLDLVMFHYMPPDQIPIIISFFEKIFTFVCKQTVRFDVSRLAFLVGEDELVINEENYDDIRQIILKQNLIFTPKVYKDKKVQEIANKVIQARAKTGLKTSIEDMITTISLYGKSYKEIADYTIYQLRSEFQRILRFENYKIMMLFKTVSSDVGNPEHFAEEIDMFVNPYSDVFKEKNGTKLDNFLSHK